MTTQQTVKKKINYCTEEEEEEMKKTIAEKTISNKVRESTNMYCTLHGCFLGGGQIKLTWNQN